MSKFLRLLLVSLALFSGFALRGQSFVEQLALSEQIKEQYGETDAGYLNALSGAVSMAFKEEKYDEAEKWQTHYLDIIEQVKGDTSDEYLAGLSFLLKIYDCIYFVGNHSKLTSERLLSLIEKRDEEKGVLLQTDTLYISKLKEHLALINYNSEEFLEYATKLIQILGKEGMSDFAVLSNIPGYELKHYQFYLSTKAQTLFSLRRMYEYEETVQELIEVTISLYGENSEETLLVILGVCDRHEMLDMMEDVIRGIEYCNKILETKECLFDSTLDSLAIMSNLHYLEGSVNLVSNPQQAKEKFLLAIAESEDAVSNNDIYGFGEISVLLLFSIGELYYEQVGDITRALEYFEKARKMLESLGDTASMDYIDILRAIARCYYDIGLSSMTINILEGASQVVEVNYGREEVAYGRIEQDKANFYSFVGDYKLSIICFMNALECYENVQGKETVEYALCLKELGETYEKMRDMVTSKEVFLEAISILEGIHSPYCVYVYFNLLRQYANAGEHDEREKLMERVTAQIEANDWSLATEIPASMYNSVGLSMVFNGKPDGKNYIEKAMDILEEKGRKSSMEYFGSMLSLALVSIYENSPSEDFIPLLFNTYNGHYCNDIAFLNSGERESLMLKSGFPLTKDILFSSRQEGEHDTQLYDFLLFNKGLLLDTSIGFRRAVLNSRNAEIIDKYKNLQNINRYRYSSSINFDNKYTIDEAKTEASMLEREITLYLRQSGGYVGGLDRSYEDVRNALGDGEIAIEFVNYKDYTDNTEYYGALMAKKIWAKPEYVRLCRGDELDSLVVESPAILYGKDSTTAYRLLWAPLEAYLDSVKTVYFSPAGHINRMAVECLHNGEQRFNEVYNVVRLTSTREICNRHPSQSHTSAVLYGGLTYEEDDEAMLVESRNVTGDISGFRNRFRGFYDGVDRRECEYLEHTLEEVAQISAIMGDAKIDNRIYSGEKGNEESFKALSGTDFDILHIATHGFYMTETQAEGSDFFSSYFLTRSSFDILGEEAFGIASPSSFSYTEISPLQRSGLILSGGNRAWMGQPIPDGVEDGVLTAAEVANLDFSSCDVVVLSACETGLGEITDEGVFGLQRAFKNAGVNTIVMSLWEVDDAATSLMMQSFYKNLVSGMTKREAFLAAQEKVREQHPDPRYWAAFIMLD